MSEPNRGLRQSHVLNSGRLSNPLGALLDVLLKGMLLVGAMAVVLGWCIHTLWTQTHGIQVVLPLEFRHFAVGVVPAGLLVGVVQLVRFLGQRYAPSVTGKRRWGVALLVVMGLFAAGVLLSHPIGAFYEQLPQQMGGMKPMPVTLMLQGAAVALYRETPPSQGTARSKPLEWVYDTRDVVWVRLPGKPELFMLNRKQVKTIIGHGRG